jgi:lipopolysaccharide/colanic/teichoic acid biosynthesis glycosyltransferase
MRGEDKVAHGVDSVIRRPGVGRRHGRVTAFGKLLGGAAIRLIDVSVAVVLLVLMLPIVVVVAIAIKLDSPGSVFYRARRAGYAGRDFRMLKFRKMRDGAEGPALTAPEDERFTRVGRMLARTKLDEIPQLLNVLRGQMSLVGPRPEDIYIVERHWEQLEPVLSVKPGITGLSQLAFARESEILDPNDRAAHYVSRILPQKIGLDTLYASRRSLWLNLRILAWTAIVVLLRRDVAVDRATGKLGLRRRPAPQLEPLPVEQSSR